MRKVLVALLGLLVLAGGYYLIFGRSTSQTPLETAAQSLENPISSEAEQKQVPPTNETLPDDGGKDDRGEAVVAEAYEPEFERIFTNRRDGTNYGAVKTKREEFLQEPLNEEWALANESRFNEFFAGKPDVLQYGTPTVACRSSLCEVRLVTRSHWPDENGNGMGLMTKPGTSSSTGGIPLVGARDTLDNGTTAVVVYFSFRERPGVRDSSK
jgi:hypothetical protein